MSAIRASWAKHRSLARWSALLLCAGAVGQNAPNASYFEFGTVVALGRQTVDIQSFDPQRQRTVQHSFTFSKETRADIVRVGDAVEVVFLPTGSDWTLKRLIVLPAGIPAAAPASLGATPPLSARLAQPGSPAAAAQPAVPEVKATPLDASKSKPAKKVPRVRSIALPQPAARPALTAPAPSTTLAATSAPKVVPAVVSVDLRASSAALAGLNPPHSKGVAISRPAEECNRSSTNWPSEPLRIAVLDFRYPTEREEAHDIGDTGGGSGTAVADLVFARLEHAEQADDRYLYSRGDRRRLDRSDFAGAARLGRQLGADAVLAGTILPVKPAGGDPEDPTPPKSYELRAGIVDTCTGQLLVQTSSLVCPGAMEPGLTAGADPAGCHHLATSASQTADPKDNARAFQPLLDDLLFPLEHPVPALPGTAPLGTVTSVQGEDLTLQLAPHASVHPGDHLALHASRIAKNPTTYTLHNLQNEEIGQLQIRSVEGATAHGTFTGDYPPHSGDIAQPTSN